MVEPIERTATRGLDAREDSLLGAVRGQCDVALARRGDLVRVASLGRPDGLAEPHGELLQVLYGGRLLVAGVRVGVQNLLAVRVQVEEADELDVVVVDLVAGPVGEALGLDGGKGRVAGERLGAGVGGLGVAVPLEGVAAVEVDALAEAEGGRLAVLAPQTVGFPRVDVAVGVERGHEDEVELLEQAGDFAVLAVRVDERPGEVVDGGGGDPFAGVGAAGDEDGAAGEDALLGVGGVDADAQGGDVAAFIGHADVDAADVGGEHGGHEAHPRIDDGEGLVVLEEGVAFASQAGRRLEIW